MILSYIAPVSLKSLMVLKHEHLSLQAMRLKKFSAESTDVNVL